MNSNNVASAVTSASNAVQSTSQMPSNSTNNRIVAGNIDLTGLLSHQMSALAMSDMYADVVFLVDEQRLPAHRIILAARSDYFRAMLYGGLCESTQSVIALNIPLQAFRTLLRYIYAGHIDLGPLAVEHVLDTFGLAHQYGFGALELAISDYLRGVLSIDNVCAILDAASLYGLADLSDVCLTFMDQNATFLLQHDTFRSLSKQALCGLLRRDSFFAPEVQIFAAVHDWSRANAGEDVAEVVALVRLSLMNMEQLLKVVRPSGILHPDRLLDVFEEKTLAKQLNYRGALWPGENVASQKFGSQVVQGEFRQALLDEDCSSYDMEKGYTRHMITDANDQGIIVELGTISIINHVKLLLWDRDHRSYFYFVEVSVNLTQWERVIDHTQYNCRSWQFLYFPARAVKYVKVVGTQNTENKIFHAVSLQAMYVDRLPALVNGFVAPRHNVATIERSAMVTRGVSRCRNVLINGDCTTYDWDSGYTCHQLGSGELLIQLGQPYWLASMRILLWDCDDRSYSFYVETSTNMREWEMAVDRRAKLLKSWQTLSFTARPVVFVKIVGTFNTANEVSGIIDTVDVVCLILRFRLCVRFSTVSTLSVRLKWNRRRCCHAMLYMDRRQLLRPQVPL